MGQHNGLTHLVFGRLKQVNAGQRRVGYAGLSSSLGAPAGKWHTVRNSSPGLGQLADLVANLIRLWGSSSRSQARIDSRRGQQYTDPTDPCTDVVQWRLWSSR